MNYLPKKVVTCMRMGILCWQPLALVIILLLTSCAGGAATTPPSADSEPAVLRIGWKGSPDTLNPAMAFLTDSYTIFNLVYDTMYELELDNTFTMSLAEAVETSADGKVWTYTIRPGVTWHDGEPLTAHDIAFTYNFYHDHIDFPYLPTYTEHFASVEAPDDTTVIISPVDPKDLSEFEGLLFQIDINEEEDVVILRQVQMFFWPWDDDEEFEEMDSPDDESENV